MVRKFKVIKNFIFITSLEVKDIKTNINDSTKYDIGSLLNIEDDIVKDGTCSLFNVNSDFAKEHGEIINTIY